MKTKAYISTIIFLLFAGIVTAQVTFETKVSKKKLGVNERLRVDFKMDRDGDNFTAPKFTGFRVAGGPIQSMNHVWNNGKRSFSKTYTYFLQPTAEGTFTIKQAKVEIEGQIYKTLPVKVQVTKAVAKPKDGNNADYVVSEGIHLVTEISNGNPYLNEPVTVSYKLYVKPGINVNDYRELGKPTFNNFWSQNLETRLKAQNGTYQGEPYPYVVLKRYVLYPQKTGKQVIEPFSIDVQVSVPTQRRDVFGRRYETVHKTLSSARRTVNVKALPEAGKPADFAGAVGDFDFQVTTSKTSLNASESLQAKIEVSGKGNLKLFQLPKLKLPSSLEVYDPEFTERVTTRITGMQGKISDSYTVVPQYKGKYPIPSVSFSYFDPKAKTYKTLRSDEIVIDVVDGPANTATADNTDNNTTTQKQLITTNGSQFRFLKTDANLMPMVTEDFFKSNLFYALLLCPFIFIPIILIVRRKKRAFDNDIEGSKTRRANRLAKKYLSEAKRKLGDKEAFYEVLERALHNYLRAKLSIETSEFSKEKIHQLLTERSVKPATVEEFISLLESCEFARYTPASDVTINKDYEKSVETISQIDKQIK
ncbi:BatD family protein [Kordia algicida OT-1]|uniref:Aerotolerance-related exported protein n=1 Tax=Kordia algicida OT-1 TaxID=391587 RepID=A9DQS8_9FLAO|nr:BatD family protein [Kordia algicida]EDP96690.1 aerotolerance-related exported protein [Kordia algicida OT-1]